MEANKLILLLVLIGRQNCATHCGLPENAYRKQIGREIVNGDVLQTVENVSLMTCIGKCKRKKSCMFINHFISTGRCQLIDLPSQVFHASYVSNPDCVVVDIRPKDACKSDPCLPSETCTNVCDVIQRSYICAPPTTTTPTTTTTTTPAPVTRCVNGDPTTGLNDIRAQVVVEATPFYASFTCATNAIDNNIDTLCSSLNDFDSMISITLPSSLYVEQLYIYGGSNKRMRNVIVGYRSSDGATLVNIVQLQECLESIVVVRNLVKRFEIYGDKVNGWSDNEDYYMQLRILRVYV